MRRSIFLLTVVLLAGCVDQRACPEYRVAGGISVDASAFVDAHPQAWTLCVTGAPCLVVNASDPQPAVVRLLADGPGSRRVDLTVTGRDGTVLLQAGAEVPVRHIVSDARCGIASDQGALTVAADGSLNVR